MNGIYIWLYVGFISAVLWLIYGKYRHGWSGVWGIEYLWFLIFATVAGPFTLIGFLACIVEDGE